MFSQQWKNLLILIHNTILSTYFPLFNVLKVKHL